MPELPEVRAHAERLHGSFAGAVLEGFTALGFTALKTADPPPDAAVGTPLVAVRSRGKHLVLDHGDVAFVVHLMQGGRLRPDAGRSAKPRGGLARWRYEDRGALLLSEAGSERKAGVWVVRSPAGSSPPLDHLGPEADELSVEDLAGRLRGASGRLHGWLREQRNLAGIGRRLANEVCHTARLSPFAVAGALDDDEVARLHSAIASRVALGLAAERRRDDMSSSAERPGEVHGRSGLPCPVCGDEVRSVEYRSYRVDYCPTCQTGGRVLADNARSRFLR